MNAEDNGNRSDSHPVLSSTEDLSEYTDADESMSAPTEFLAEFLSAVMMKEYENALKYCKLILQYEPNNSTAKEFYPLIQEKIMQAGIEKDAESDTSDDESDSSSSSDPDSSSSIESSNVLEEDEDEEGDEEEMKINVENKKASKSSYNGENTTGSYSSLEDDEAIMDQLMTLTAMYKIDNVDVGNGNKIYHPKQTQSSRLNCKIDNINKKFSGEEYTIASSSNLETSTEPVTQETTAMLRARVVPN